MEESDSHVQIPGIKKLAPSPDERTSGAMRQMVSDIQLKEGAYGHLETDFDSQICNSRNTLLKWEELMMLLLLFHKESYFKKKKKRFIYSL